jgi:Methyltransferase FkbM domain
MKQLIKDTVVPRGCRPRRLPLGLGRGLTMDIDLHQGKIRTYLGTYEMELARGVRDLWRRGRTSFDVGGADGYYTLIFAQLTGAAVVAFEPDETLCSTIRRNVSLNPSLAGLVEVRNAFVGSGGTPGEVSLDDVAEETFIPDLIKFDIEGAEATALRGAAKILERRRPGLLIEVHGESVEADCRAILAGHGYPPPKVVNLRRWLPEGRPIPHNRWLIADGS